MCVAALCAQCTGSIQLRGRLPAALRVFACSPACHPHCRRLGCVLNATLPNRHGRLTRAQPYMSLVAGRRNVLNDLKRVVAQEAYEYRWGAG